MKVNVCKVKVAHVRMAHRGSEAELYSFFLFTLNESDWLFSRPGVLPQRKESPCLLDRTLRWLQDRLGPLE